MFNKYGVLNPKETEALKYINEFNHQVQKAVKEGKREFYIDQDYQTGKSLYDFLMELFRKDKDKFIFEDYSFIFQEDHDYIYVTWD